MAQMKAAFLSVAIFASIPSALLAQQVSGGGGGASTPGGSNTQIQYNNSGAFGGAGTLTSGGAATLTTIAVNGATLGSNAFAVKGQTGIGIGNQSGASIYGTTGFNLSQPTGTDTDTASSGTIATTYVNQFGTRTLAASAATTLTASIGNFFDAPAAGTNVTFTNPGMPAVFNTNDSAGTMFGMQATANTSGYRSYAWVSGAGQTIKLQRWNNNFAGAAAGLIQFDNSVTTDTMVVVTGAFTFPGIATDATHTDSTVCQDTSSHAFYAGSGTLGVCLGTSSARFKPFIAPIKTGLSQIMALEPIRYTLDKDHGDPDKILYGFTAEQGGTVLPELMGRDTEGRPNTFDYLGVVPVLVRALQEQQAEIQELKNRIVR